MAGAFQTNAFQNNAFQVGAVVVVRRWQDLGFYGPGEDDDLKQRLEELAELRARKREDDEDRKRDLREDVVKAYHYKPPEPPPKYRRPRPVLMPPPAGPINPAMLAQLMAATQPQPMPQAPAPMPAPQPMAGGDPEMAAIDAMFADIGDIDELFANDPELQQLLMEIEQS